MVAATQVTVNFVLVIVEQIVVLSVVFLFLNVPMMDVLHQRLLKSVVGGVIVILKCLSILPLSLHYALKGQLRMLCQVHCG